MNSYYQRRKAGQRRREEYLRTVFRRDTPLPFPGLNGRAMRELTDEEVKAYAHGQLAHAQLNALFRAEIEHRKTSCLIGGGC